MTKFFKNNQQEFVEYQILPLLYLRDKYPEELNIILPKQIGFERYDFQIVWICNGKGGGDLYLPKILFPESQKRFTLISIHLWSCPNNEAGGHMNCLLIDNKLKRIERIDPNGKCAKGKEWYDVEIFDKKLEIELQKIFPLYKYFPPYLYLPEIGPQKYQLREKKERLADDPNGFCVAWCNLIVELKMIYPDCSTKDIFEMINKILKNKYTEYIRAYSFIILNNQYLDE
jgi:hypothetical protein